MGAGREAGAPAGTQAPPTTSLPSRAARRSGGGEWGAPNPRSRPTTWLGARTPSSQRPPAPLRPEVPGSRAGAACRQSRKVLSPQVSLPGRPPRQLSPAGRWAGCVTRAWQGLRRPRGVPPPVCGQDLSSGPGTGVRGPRPWGCVWVCRTAPSGTRGVTVCLGMTGQLLSAGPCGTPPA